MVSFRNQSEVVSVNPGCACTSLEKLISVKCNPAYGQKSKLKRAESTTYNCYNIKCPLHTLMASKRAMVSFQIRSYRTAKAAVLPAASFWVPNLNLFYTMESLHNEK